MALLHGEPKIVTDNLVLCLDAGNTKSYPGTGTSWTDMINGHTATMIDASWYLSVNGGVMDFDGTDDRITLPNTAQPNGLGSTFSIEIWHYLSNSTAPGSMWTYGSLFTNGGGASDWNSGAGNNNGLIIGFDIMNSRNQSGTEVWKTYSPAPSVQTWHQYVFTLNSGTGNMYIDKNNVMSNNTDFRTNYGQVTGTTGIGLADVYNGTVRGEYDGLISVVRIYDKVLSTAEIEQNFDATKTRFGL